MKIKIIKMTSKHYSPLLREIHNPPQYIYAIGDLDLLHNKSIAMVGSRKMSKYGERVTRQLANNLATAGFTIVSGMALGVDGQAHLGALDVGGKTIAVLGSGVNNPTPKTHQQLSKNIVNNNGLIISEYEPDAPALKHHFPERNRIISGLSEGVIVTEATQRSGSLITARLALEQNREVFAVPGNINQPNSQGTNGLIKNGATPVTKTEDVLHQFGYEKVIKETPVAQNAEEATILNCINKGIRKTDAIAEEVEMKPKKIQHIMSMLEIRGIIRNSGGGEWYIV